MIERGEEFKSTVEERAQELQDNKAVAQAADVASSVKALTVEAATTLVDSSTQPDEESGEGSSVESK